MPDKEIKKTTEETTFIAPAAVKEAPESVSADVSTPHHHGRPTTDEMRRRRGGLILGLSAIIVVVIALLVAAAILIFSDNNTSSTTTAPAFSQRSSRLAQRTGYGYGASTQTQVTNGAVTTTVYNYVTGVVTAVNSDNIIIAGNGKQTTIQTNSSTTYDNDTKPAVNDTVTVAGTTSGTTVTATEIAVNN